MKSLRVWTIAWLVLGPALAAEVRAWDEPVRTAAEDGRSLSTGGEGAIEFDPIGPSTPADRNPSAKPADEGLRWPSFPKPKLPKVTLPKLSLPSWGTEDSSPRRAPERMPDEPSAWSKFNSGTKDFFTKAKHTIMPWSDDDDARPASKPSSVTRRSTARTRTKAKPAGSEKKSLFPWFSRKEPEEPISTVNDFLSQPRVQ